MRDLMGDVINLQQYLKIEKDELDEELIHQASLLHAASEAYEVACSERDDAKEALATADALLDAAWRKKLGEKTTEGNIKGHVQSDPQHAVAYEDYATKRLEAGKAKALKDAFSDKSDNIRELCGLYRANYYERDSVRSNDYEKALYTRTMTKLAEARASKERD